MTYNKGEGMLTLFILVCVGMIADGILNLLIKREPRTPVTLSWFQGSVCKYDLPAALVRFTWEVLAFICFSMLPGNWWVFMAGLIFGIALSLLRIAHNWAELGAQNSPHKEMTLINTVRIADRLFNQRYVVQRLADYTAIFFALSIGKILLLG